MFRQPLFVTYSQFDNSCRNDGQTICSIILKMIFPMKFLTIFNHGDKTLPNTMVQSSVIRIFFAEGYISILFGPILVVVVSRLQLSYLMVVNSYDPRCAFTALRVKAKVTLAGGAMRM